MFKEKMKDIEKSLELFSLPELTTLKELKRLYRNLTKQCHPDKHPENPEWSNQKMIELNRAYEILKRTLKTDKNIKVRNVRNISINEIIRIGDQIIRDSVVLGWLKKYPDNKNGIALKNKLKETYLSLNDYGEKKENIKFKEYYLDLFSSFLNVTEWKVARPLPKAWNSTRFFRQLSDANGFLDSGIRQFYYYLEKNRLKNMKNIPFSYLKDAKSIYRYLLVRTYDEPNKEMIEKRIKLAELFIERIRDAELNEI
jgi:curved DNA-binding protein CbpA